MFSFAPFHVAQMPNAPVSILNPVELMVDRIGLQELVRDNIKMHQLAQLTTLHTDASRLQARVQLEQLEAFVAWLDEPEQLAHPHVSVFVYPELSTS